MIMHADTFTRLCRELVGCRGRGRAVTLAELADRIGASRRDVEQIIEHRLVDFPWPIVAGSKGVFIPAEASDLNQYLHNLHSRHRRMQIREATVRRKARIAGWPEQSGQFTNPIRATQQELFA
jgi:hypothetical protein